MRSPGGACQVSSLIGTPWSPASCAYCRIDAHSPPARQGPPPPVVLLDDLAGASETVGATSARGGKIAALADALRSAAPEEAAIAVAFLSGELRQRQIGVGWAALQELPPPAGEPSRGLAGVGAAVPRPGAFWRGRPPRARR